MLAGRRRTHHCIARGLSLQRSWLFHSWVIQVCTLDRFNCWSLFLGAIRNRWLIFSKSSNFNISSIVDDLRAILGGSEYISILDLSATLRSPKLKRSRGSFSVFRSRLNLQSMTRVRSKEAFSGRGSAQTEPRLINRPASHSPFCRIHFLVSQHHRRTDEKRV